MGLAEIEVVNLFDNIYLASIMSYFKELDIYAEVKRLNLKRIFDKLCFVPHIGTRYNHLFFGYSNTDNNIHMVRVE